MIPNVFISSTVKDLQYLRDAIRDTISEIGYNPVMSDYGEVGYLPTISAESSCYERIKECQIVILIMGKRYGEIKENGNSVTHNEYLTAVDNKIPIICLVDQEVLSYKKVFDSDNKITSFPDMDSPTDTFSLIDEFIDSKFNNGFLSYSHVENAQKHVKIQLAHIFGYLLNEQFDPLKSDITDVLAEIKTIKNILSDTTIPIPPNFRIGLRILLDNHNRFIYRFLSKIFNDIEQIVIPFISNDSLKKFANAIEWETKTVKINDFLTDTTYKGYRYRGMFHHLPEGMKVKKGEKLSYCIDRKNKTLVFNDLSYKYFVWKYQDLREQLDTEINN